MTAEELFNKYKEHTALTEGHYDYLVDEEDFKEALVEFAKYHVEQALKEASEKANIIDEYIGGGLNIELKSIDKDSIINAYSLENIK